VVHLNLDQVVDNFRVQVFINESLPVIQVHVPELKTDSNTIDSPNKENKFVEVEKNVGDDPSKVKITFHPDIEIQKQMLERQNDKDGIRGQFIVEYDVDRKNEGNDVQVLDGYFVHFFAPEFLGTLPKHVIFVLDISGSMYGEKLQQTKDAMVTILDDLTEKDYFNILSFSDEVIHWVPDAEKNLESPHSLTHKGTKELRDEALRYVLKLNTLGGTNIHDAMMEALKLVTDVKIAETAVPRNTNPIIVFLTDGEPTTGVTSGPEIERLIARANQKLEVPIYGLAFGKGADFTLVKSISSTSGAYARKIFEGSDAAIQLEDFYLELANPLLNNVKFEYVGEPFKNGSITNTNFKTYFKGSEYVIAGQISDDNLESEEIQLIVGGEGDEGTFEKKFNLCFLRPLPLPIDVDADLPNRPTCIFPPIISKPEPERTGAQNFIERLWAFLTIKNLLDDKLSAKEKRIEELTADDDNNSTSDESTDDPKALPSRISDGSNKKSRAEQALALALKYNFVTKLTSLVVTRDETTNSTDNVEVDVLPILDSTHHIGHGRRSHHYKMASRAGSFNALQSNPYVYSSARFSAGPPGPGNQPVKKKTSLNFGPPTAVPFFKLSRGIPAKVKLLSVNAMDDDDVLTPESLDYDSGSLMNMAMPNEPCRGSLILYRQTYLRGQNITTSVDIPDLSDSNFDDKVT
jgi:uncharacterized protein YegL